MIRVIIILVMLFSVGLQLSAQDTLYHASKGKLIVKVLEISDTEVKYKLSSNPDGPLYVMRKKDAQKIVYASGSIETFQKTPETKPIPKKKLKHQNFVYFTISDLVLGHLSFSYEHTLLNNHLGIHIPVSVGIIELSQKKYYEYSGSNIFLNLGEYGYYNKNKIFSAGIELYYYPFEWRYANYFVGPSFGYGIVNYQTSHYTYNPSNPIINHTEQVEYQGWLIKNGVLFMPNKHLCFSISLAMGFYSTHEIYYNNNNFNDPFFFRLTSRAVEGGFSVGLKF